MVCLLGLPNFPAKGSNTMVKTKQKLGPWQTAWLETLESGMFKQDKNCLCSLETNAQQDIEYSFCCLGLVCEVAVENGEQIDIGEYKPGEGAFTQVMYSGAKVTYGGRHDYLPSSIVDLFCFKDEQGRMALTYDHYDDEVRDWLAKNEFPQYSTSLSSFNDHAVPFEKIAKIVRAFPYLFFTEPA